MKIKFALGLPLLTIICWFASNTFAQAGKPTVAKFLGGQITVPAGYRAEHVVGPDFDVDYVIPENTTPNTTNVMFGVYVGSFPGYDPPKKGVTTERGSFAGKRFRWRIWKTKTGEKTSVNYQAIVRLEGGQWLWHIFLAAPDLATVRKLQAVMRTYRPPAETK